MTERLYYQDSKLLAFQAQVIAQRQTERGPAVQLDRTAFYPTSGGQPFDTGYLGGVQVLDVWDEDGVIWHLLNQPLETDHVSGEIDWVRRFDHMQQHTGQHLLSAAFVHEMDAQTLSFHLGGETSTIDLDAPDLSREAADRVEQTVNRVVWEDRPVNVLVVGQDELAQIPLRKPPQVEGKIRVVWVDGYDASACGGTHVSRTGEVGLIKIVSLERYKGGVRVSFLCGERALRDYRRTLRELQDTSADLSVHTSELRETVSRLNDEARQTRRALKHLRSEYLNYEAERIWNQTQEVNGDKRITSCFDDRPFEEVRQLAMLLREYSCTKVLFAVREDTGIKLVCTRSDDLQDESAADILRAAAEALGGRGGGSPTVAQGGAPDQTCERVMAAIAKVAGQSATRMG